MTIGKEKVDQLLDLIRTDKDYSGFQDFNYPHFVKEEREYKIKTVEKAKEYLAKEELRRLIESGEYDEVIARLKQIGTDNNLPWNSVPLEGDLRYLYLDDLDKKDFCGTVFDLLYGRGSSGDRIDRFVAFCDRHDLATFWTFPTYFLFICHPDTEIFIKPRASRTFLNLIGSKCKLGYKPDGKTYEEFRKTALELKEAMSPLKPRDMVDIQSFLWICVEAADLQVITAKKSKEFESLFSEFLEAFTKSKEGLAHWDLQEKSRERARENFPRVVEKADAGEDVTNFVLEQFLPHQNTPHNRDRGVWIHVAPVIRKDLKSFFEGAGWAKASDWPENARLILDFVRRCEAEPDELKGACASFASNYSGKGIQAAILTPILHDLRPDSFIICNNKSLKVLNHLTGKTYTTNLAELPEANKTGLALIEALSDTLTTEVLPDTNVSDVFDAFCHWLVAVKKYRFTEVNYYKIAPGEGGENWDACCENGYITVGWDSVGNISNLTKKEFEKVRDEHVAKHASESSWTKTALNQLWNFSRIKEGDQIVANRGKSLALGFGTVTGPYYFVEDEDWKHRLPVEWTDTNPRKIEEGGWSRTMVRLDCDKYESLINSPTIGIEYPGSAFTARTFELLEGLHRNPTKDYYDAHKSDIKRYVEQAFQALFRNVVKRLPESITLLMESQRYVFSKIVKNDYGRGGAWDFYWGALYPKEGKRTEGVQLFISIRRDRLGWGFSMSDNSGDQHKRFERNCLRHRTALRNCLRDSLDGLPLMFGDTDDDAVVYGKVGKTDWCDWIDDIQTAGMTTFDFILREDALKTSKDDLCQRIANLFSALFPLVFLATSDEPLHEIAEYLGGIPIVKPEIQPAYSLAQCEEETGFTKRELERCVRAIQRKKQAVLSGPPGTGKTYLAERLARNLIGGTDGFQELLQFHPEYAYQDFIQGIRPDTTVDGALSYETKRGRFLIFCEKARQREGLCVLIIDEINRANLSQVFGELMYLLEYRNKSIPLAGGGQFKIPDNVRIIGTMNTADRSIALVDYALRRRFAFIDLRPNYDVLRNFHKGTGFPVDGLVEVLKLLNTQINDPHYEVGISFFLQKSLKDELEDIWTMEIEPYLLEYFFDQPNRVEKFTWEQIRKNIEA